MNNTTSLLRQIEKRIQLKRELEESQKNRPEKNEPTNSLVTVPNLPNDCISDVIVRLPLESLCTSRFVCKSWYGIVNNPNFIAAHLKKSDIGLIFLTPSTMRKSSGSSSSKIIFSVESKALELQSMPVHHYPLINPPPLFYINFLEIKDGKCTVKEYNATCRGKIRATCNGLIILENLLKKGGLIVMNPVTKEMKPILYGTRTSPQNESYGLAYCSKTNGYKLVHLFRDELSYVGCEIISIGSGYGWRVVDGPTRGFFDWFGYEPIFALGALNWVPRVDHNEYMVSMHLGDEKFRKVPLPGIGGIHDRVFEMSGFLGFVSRENTGQIDVWMLRSLGGEGWEKQYSINVDSTRNMVPLYCMRMSGELVFRCKDNDLYAYDRYLQLMRRIEVNEIWSRFINCYYPQVNSLISLTI